LPGDLPESYHNFPDFYYHHPNEHNQPLVVFVGVVITTSLNFKSSVKTANEANPESIMLRGDV
jgi:hypothetical protein